MARPKVNYVAGALLLASFCCATPILGQIRAPKRLPLCDVEYAGSTMRRLPAVVQASSLQVVHDGQETSGIQVVEPRRSEEPPVELLPGPLTMSHPFLMHPDIGLEEYAIQPGDDLEIKFRFTPELNEVVTVRPDGMISLRIVGDVLAATQTPEVLRRTLMGAYRVSLKDPALVVLVRRFAGNHVFVGGEVQLPGRINISGQITALQAIILAGGFKDTSDKKRILLRRDDGWCEELNLKAEIHGQIVGYDVLLRPYDIIYVPKSRIAKINLFVDQFIEKVIPFQRSAGVFVSREVN